MYTLQETFDISSLALVAQGRPGADAEGGCSYVDGCAAGHLVPVEVRDRLAGFVCGSQNRQYFIDAGHNVSFVQNLQDIHDEEMQRNRTQDEGDASVFVINVAGWRRAWLPRLCRFAREHGLDPSRVIEAAKAAGWEV